MVNRVQTLRSSSQGSRPTGRSPGELYVNFPDNALGVVNAAGTATDLVAVRFFSTGANYVVGDYVVNAGVLYRAIATSAPGAFTPAKWSKVTALEDTAATYVPLAGGTMTGLLVLSADPSALLGAATKQYVDAADALKANLASPTFTGDPKAPTPTAGDSDTSIATTAFVTTADNLKVAKAGDTMTGNLTISPAAGSANLQINPTAATQQALINFFQTGAAKWQLGKQNDDSFMLFDSVAAALVLSTPSNGTLVTFSRAVSVPANSVAATPAAGDNSTKIATTAFVQSVAPPAGTIFAWSTSTPPAGYALCYGQNITRASAPNLNAIYSAAGYPFGVGDGSTTFGLPDLRGRVIAGVDAMGGTPANKVTTTYSAVGGFASVAFGAAGGEEAHVLNETQTGPHAHDMPVRSAATGFGSNFPALANASGSQVTLPNGATTAGGGGAHNTAQPTMFLNYIVRL